MKPKLFDTVRLREALPNDRLSVGQVGAIVETFSVPDEAYEVEFLDGAGSTVAITTLRPSQFDVVVRHRG